MKIFFVVFLLLFMFNVDGFAQEEADTLGRVFTTVMPLPEKIVLLSPEHNAEIQLTEPMDDTIISLHWETDIFSTEYELQVYLYDTCEEIDGVLDIDTCEMYLSEVFTESTSYELPVPFDNVTYGWRVRGINISGSGEWSGE